jgi:hypothetical protein
VMFYEVVLKVLLPKESEESELYANIKTF